ncbi:MAG: MoxR family ATPase [candidate division Zixibacteria bacterium]|nr:MoxR family ATPase [candidate division Zixibacteria bacterium]
MNTDIREIQALVDTEASFVTKLTSQISSVIVGQKYLIERLLMGVLADGHILIEGVPGLAKTLSVKTLADAIQAKFQRIQFTPDLLPADLIGTLIYNPQKAEFSVRKGPIFANIVLADEINRAPAKVQSALLEAMQERQVTIGDSTYKLDEPFLVLATQNPIEQEGTYPLPEAQVDRFMFKLKIGYPSPAEEREIMDRNTGAPPVPVQKVVTPQDIIRARAVLRQVYVDEKVKEYIVNITFATREPEKYGLADLKDLIAYGGSPRATIYLNLGAKAHAFVRGRGYVTPEDVKAVGPDILRHRVLCTYEAEAEEITPDDIVQKVFNAVEVP